MKKSTMEEEKYLLNMAEDDLDSMDEEDADADGDKDDLLVDDEEGEEKTESVEKLKEEELSKEDEY